MPRPLSFDPQQKLQLAMMLFLKDGYHQTSISELISTLQINKFSLYKQFGNKEALFLQALELYTQSAFSPLLAPLEAPQKGKAALDTYLDNFTRQLEKPGAQYGCLLMNTHTEGTKVPAPIKQAIQVQIKRLLAALTENFEAAKKQGDLSKEVKECVSFTLMCIQALLSSRKTQDKKISINNTNFFRETMKGW